jgi:uncharacterized membrane protein (DUF4010 family)
MIGMLGFLTSVLHSYSVWFSAFLSFGFMGILIAYYIVSSKKFDSFGATTEIAAMSCFMIGILIGVEEFFLGTVAALIVWGLLYFKDAIHNWTFKLEAQELISAIEFLIVVFVVLPLLPNQGYGPFEFFNPYMIWLMVTFISGISFLSYIAIKIFGDKKGIVLTGFFAGFISSTALTSSYSIESKKNKSVTTPYLVAVVVASSAMFFRVLVEVFVINRELFVTLVLPLAVAGGVGVAVATWLYWHEKKGGEEEKIQEQVEMIKSPFRLGPAIKFALFFSVVLFLTKFANSYTGDGVLYVTSLVSGVVDVDAITISVANLVNDGLDLEAGRYAIMIAAVTNTFVKAGIFMLFGNPKVGLKIFLVFASMVAAGAGVAFLF